MRVHLVRLLICYGSLALAIASADSIAVVFDDSRFGTIDSTTGTYTQISDIPLNEAAGIAAGLTSLYVEDIYSNLLSIDPSTGVATLVGNSGLNLTVPVFGGTASGMYEGAGGLYALDTASNLYSISASTGLATLIGPTGLNPNNFQYDTSLSSDGTSLYYTAGPGGGIDELYRINTTTGQATDLGSTGVGSVAGSAFVNGSLDLFQYGQSVNYLYSAPAGSVLFTQETALSTQIVDGGAVMAAVSNQEEALANTPEPAAIVMTLSGLALIVVGWRRRPR